MGFAYANEQVIQYMNNVKAPYNVNRLSQEVAVRALSDRSLYKERVAAILEVWCVPACDCVVAERQRALPWCLKGIVRFFSWGREGGRLRYGSTIAWRWQHDGGSNLVHSARSFVVTEV